MRPIDENDLAETVAKIVAEYRRAVTLYPIPMRSSHEGWAILREEVDEMWDDVKGNDIVHAKKEAVQVAAMALSFILEVPERIR